MLPPYVFVVSPYPGIMLDFIFHLDMTHTIHTLSIYGPIVDLIQLGSLGLG